MSSDEIAKLQLGDAVYVGDLIGTYQGPHPRFGNAVWVEFAGSGKWTYDIGDVATTNNEEHS